MDLYKKLQCCINIKPTSYKLRGGNTTTLVPITVKVYRHMALRNLHI